jgi:cyclin B
LKNPKGRVHHSKTVNEVIQHSKRDGNASIKNGSFLATSSNLSTQPDEKLVQQTQISLPNVVVNNEIMSGAMDDQMSKDTDVMMEDDQIVLKKVSVNPENYINSNVPDVVFNPRPQLCEEYIPEIFEHLKEIEFDHLPSAGYMKQQQDINEKMRGILIDWLVEVHLKFKLLPETLFLTINLIDRYLEIKQILRNRLQLIGVTAMLIACKYEEIYAPEVRDFVYITDKAYTKDEILQMENDMLEQLKYNITVPSPLRYLEIYNYFLKLDDSSLFFCRYLLELFLIDYKMLKYNPSLLASSSIYITLKITKKCESEKIFELTGYSEEKIRECSKDICLIIENVDKNSLQAIKKKFSMPKFLEVAKIKFN